MNRFMAVPLILTGAWLILSLVSVVNLLMVFYLLDFISSVSVQTGIADYDKYFFISSGFYGVLAIFTFFIYLKIEKQWKEFILGLLFFCFAITSLFPLILKLFAFVEPPYILNFVVLAIVAGSILTFAGQIKFRSMMK